MNTRQTKIENRGRIIGMRESGLSPSEISRELGISRSVIYRWIKRWEEESTLNDRPRSGAPRKTTEDQDAQIREMVEANPFTNAVSIQEELQLPVTSRTVRKRLHADGIHHIVCDKNLEHKITRKKKEAWKGITNIFNAASVGDKRTEKQVRKMWERVKGKKKHAMKKKELLKTGGGVPAEDVDDKTAKVYDIIYDELKDLDNVFDSDSLTDDTQIHVSSVSAAEDLEDLRPSSSNSSRQSPLQSDVEQKAKKGKKEWKFSPAAECYEQSLKMHEREHEMDMKIKEAQLEGAQEFIVACKSIKHFAESATQAIKEAAIAVQEAAKAISGK
ncbi:uncharacterized protein LOC119573203 [Penaeus monodon]|uniref:uncharacterized protein LOC119573203 n=1 Tax=Penaeus monodon TaxID=6687 RepID=UPI0018A77DD6|nr:uncharacterized protein LOC119573203 [Penaeus monodon]